MAFPCDSDELNCRANFVCCPLVKFSAHIVANGEKFFNAIDQCAKDDDLLWDVEADCGVAHIVNVVES